MAILAVGGEADCFEPVSGDFAFDTTSGHFTANLARHAMQVEQGVSDIQLNLPGGGVTEAWWHFEVYIGTMGAEDNFIVWYDDAGDNAFRLTMQADGGADVDFWSGAAWVELATFASGVFVADTLQRFDIFIVVDGVDGVFDIWRNGQNVGIFEGDTLGDFTEVTSIHFNGRAGGTTANIGVSQVIVSEEDPERLRLATLTPSGNGGETDWLGAFGDVDDTGYSDGDFIESQTVDEVETFTATDVNGAFSSYPVVAVAVAMRAINDTGSDIGDIQAALRISSTNYFSASLNLAQDDDYHSVQAIFEDNPATTAEWANVAAVNGAEIGVKSVA